MAHDSQVQKLDNIGSSAGGKARSVDEIQDSRVCAWAPVAQTSVTIHNTNNRRIAPPDLRSARPFVHDREPVEETLLGYITHVPCA